MRRWSWLVVLGVAAEGILAAQAPTLTGGLGVERSSRALRASGAAFAGVKWGWPAAYRPEEPGPDHSQAVRGEGFVFFDAAPLDHSSGGLGRYKPGDAHWYSYPLSMVAEAAGWYPPGSRAARDSIRGLAIGGGRVWMGSIGVGVLARDLRDGTWSRHDTRAWPTPDAHAIVLHADDDYVFVESVRPEPAIEVYSIRQAVWLRLRAVPRENVLEFGWTSSDRVMIRCDTRPMAFPSEVPLTPCTQPRLVKPLPEGRGYELSKTFDEPGAPLRILVRKKELEAAFQSLAADDADLHQYR